MHVCFFFLQLYGARPIRRWLQKNVMTRLSEMLIKGVDACTTIMLLKISKI
jgi:ATP-dependent Clp protease ATP-binding subunit ClpA